MKKRLIFFGLLTAAGSAFAESPAEVAGLAPDRRPAHAPVITDFEQTPEWRAQALRGIAPPQTGLGFLKDQGAWYTPFNHPNMPGPYDLRHLQGPHKKDGP